MKKKLLLSLLFAGFTTFAQTITLETVATGFPARPVEIANDGSNRLYVAQQSGVISIIEADGTVNPTPFIDLGNVVNYQGELGLLGMTFHPEYATNGYFYVDYLDAQSNTVIARYNRDAVNPDIADPTSAHVVLNITQAWGRHQGGCVAFGPDGYLYISSGDGGISENGQDTNTLLGKMLRIDVNNGVTYTIPETNPFATTDGADEIWSYGMRNPWKFTFSRADGSMWIADVGESVYEEINKVSVTTPGLNFGWRCYEGDATYDTTLNCPEESTLTFPVAQYDHAYGCSITGGYVYTGTEYPNLQGKYFFADYCSNRIGWVSSTEPNAITWTEPFEGNFTTFGQDANGELYLAGGSNGTVYKITEATAATAPFNKAGITLYPNPAKNEVFLNLKNFSENTMVTIYDMGGKRLIKQQLTSSANRIDTTALQAGIYLIEVNAAGNRMQQKLVIN